MKMKFFERSYIITLVLFLIFFNGGIFLLAYYTYHNNLNAELQVARAEQYLIRESYEQDHNSGGKFKLEQLQSSYGDFYLEKGIMLCFKRGGEITYSNIPENLGLPDDGVISTIRIDGEKHVIISESICDGAIILTYAKDISHLDDEFRSMMLTFAFVSLLASVLIAILLYYIQSKLLEPLKKLRGVTKDISSGNFSARADDSANDEFAELAQDFNAMTDKIND